MRHDAAPGENADEIRKQTEAAVARLAAAESDLRALAGGELDAVLDSQGRTFLLQTAQENLLASEHQQRELAEFHRLVFDALPAQVAILDSEGKIVAVNARWPSCEGGTQRLPLGENYLAICDRGKGLDAEWGYAAAEGIRRVLQRSVPDFTLEYPCHSPEAQRWFLLSASPLHADQPDGAILMHIDITARKLAEQRAQQQAALLDKAQDAILVLSLNDTILYANESAKRLYGLHLTEPQNTGELMNSQSTGFQEARQSVLANDEWSGELTQFTKAHAELILECRWTLVRDDHGAPSSILAIHTDVTERRRLEAQFFHAQRVESIGILAGGIAHDLNNVLAPILLATDILATEVTESGRSILETVRTTAQRGADLIKQVLSIARGAEGPRTQVAPGELIREVTALAAETFPKSITLQIGTAPDLWTVRGDLAQLHQVLLNLYVNARDAMSAGGTLSVSASNTTLDESYAATSSVARPGRYVAISVSDNGTGVPAEIRDKIFDPFFTTKDVGKGTGLGLSTSMAVVKSHGGFIEVQSEPGHGSTFTVYLPADLAPERAAVNRQVDPAPNGTGQLILLVDDEEAVRLVTKRTLEKSGYRVITASDGVDAVAAYVRHRSEVTLVISDMMMPIMDGPKMIQTLRQIDPNVRIIGTTGYAPELEKQSEIAALDYPLLLKPYTGRGLLEAVRVALA
jgi:PAS domain S-box-containing protein